MNVLIIGVGLIGGSFALALRDRGLAERIEGVEASEEHARRALERGLVDRIVTLEEGLPSADLIVLATPVDTIPLLTVKILNRIAPHQVVMDTGSIKGELCEVVAMHARRGRFVATHPMWGTEYSGPDAASRGAFAGRTAVICERERSDRDAVETVERLYGALGMPLVSMEPEEHDLHTAYVSPCWRRSARSSISSTWRAAASNRRCDWPRVHRARGCRFCCATSTMCSTCCASISTSCRSCGA